MACVNIAFTCCAYSSNQQGLAEIWSTEEIKHFRDENIIGFPEEYMNLIGAITGCIYQFCKQSLVVL